MKKALSLLLAAALVLGLCVTAFAGSSSGSPTLALTGDAADQAVGVTNGQTLSTDGSTLVRLNVQSDPTAEEYAVTLNGETLEEDHSTSLYHVYSLPADKLTARTATLKVMNSTAALTAENGAPAAVKVGTTEVTLTADGSNTYTGTVNADETAGMRRIYLTPDDGWTLYSDSACEKELTRMDAGWTADELYFYFAAQKQTQTVYAKKSDNTTATIILTCSEPTQKFTFSGGSGYANDTTPAGIGTENYAGANYRDGDGTYTGVNGGYNLVVYPVYLYKSGTQQTATASYDITTSRGTKDDLYYMGMAVTSTAAGDATESLLFHRPGYYPIAVASGSEHGTVPFVAVLSETALEQRIKAAEAVNTANLTGAADAVTRLNEVKSTLSAVKGKYDNMGNYANADTKYVAADGKLTDEETEITARDFDGVAITLQRYNEGLECELMDLTAMLTTWQSDATLAKYQYQAYQKLTALGLNSYTDVTTAAEKTLYSAVKQAKWDVLHTSGTTEDDAIKAVNVVLQGEELTKLVAAAGKTELTAVEKPTETEEPRYILGDVDGNGKVEPRDAGLLLQYVNELISEDSLDLNAADVDGNGKVEPKDAGYLLQYVNEIIEKLPAEQ